MSLYSRERTGDYVARVVAIGAVDGNIHVFSATGGEPLAELRLGGAVFSSCVFCAGNLVVGCRDDRVYCLDLVSASAAVVGCKIPRKENSPIFKQIES